MKQFIKGKVTLIQADCMDIMKDTPDNYYDLAVVDPPYGIGMSKNRSLGKRGKTYQTTKYKKGDWDNEIPDKIYFDELFRVSKNQIIWGGNYFIEYLKNTRCVLFWDKQYIPAGFSMADCEMAWTSFNANSKRVRVKLEHNNISNNKEKAKIKAKIHQSQKPISLYNWLLKNYAKPEFKVLDTHGGSFSSAIAAYYFGCEFTGIEKDEDYFNDAVKRFKRETMMEAIKFVKHPKPQQTKLFK